MKTFGVFDGGDVAKALQVQGSDVAVLIAAGEFPAPDAYVNDPSFAYSWGWNASTAGTAIAALSAATVQSVLQAAKVPSNSGGPTVGPYRPAASFNRWT